MITAVETHYIWPPRATTCIPRDDTDIFAQMNYIAQLKYNDTRCLIKITSTGDIQLWNRHAERIRNYYPTAELQDQLKALAQPYTGYTLFDGGLLDKKHSAIKDTIVIWDILVQNGNYLIGTTYENRFQHVQALANGPDYIHKNHDGQEYNLGTTISPNIFTPRNIQPEQWPETWAMIDQINLPHLAKGAGPLIEGLVFKQPKAPLEFGFSEINNSSWMSRSRVTTGRHAF